MDRTVFYSSIRLTDTRTQKLYAIDTRMDRHSSFRIITPDGLRYPIEKRVPAGKHNDGRIGRLAVSGKYIAHTALNRYPYMSRGQLLPDQLIVTVTAGKDRHR